MHVQSCCNIVILPGNFSGFNLVINNIVMRFSVFLQKKRDISIKYYYYYYYMVCNSYNISESPFHGFMLFTLAQYYMPLKPKLLAHE